MGPSDRFLFFGVCFGPYPVMLGGSSWWCSEDCEMPTTKPGPALCKADALPAVLCPSESWFHGHLLLTGRGFPLVSAAQGRTPPGPARSPALRLLLCSGCRGRFGLGSLSLDSGESRGSCPRALLLFSWLWGYTNGAWATLWCQEQESGFPQANLVPEPAPCRGAVGGPCGEGR